MGKKLYNLIDFTKIESSSEESVIIGLHLYGKLIGSVIFTAVIRPNLIVVKEVLAQDFASYFSMSEKDIAELATSYLKKKGYQDFNEAIEVVLDQTDNLLFLDIFYFGTKLATFTYSKKKYDVVYLIGQNIFNNKKLNVSDIQKLALKNIERKGFKYLRI